MTLALRYIASLIIGILFISLPFNPIKDIPNSMQLSFSFVCIIMSGVLGITAVCYKKSPQIKISIIDIWVCFIILINIYFYPPYYSITGLAKFSLGILYWSIRQLGNLNITIFYGSVYVSILILTIIGYLQLLQIIPTHNSYFILTGYYKNPSIYAGVLSILLSIPTVNLLNKKGNSKLRLTSLVLILTTLPVLWLTECRSAWIAFIVVIAFLTKKNYHFKKKWTWALIVSILFIFIMGWMYQIKKKSADGRVLIWKVTMEMIKEKPLTGFGPRRFIAEYMNYQGEYLAKKGTDYEKRLADNNHCVYNEPLRCIVEYGIIGIILYTIICTYIFKYRTNSTRGLISKVTCISGLVWGLFSYPDQVLPILAVLTIMLAEMVNNDTKDLIWSSPVIFKSIKITMFLIIILQSIWAAKSYKSHKELYIIEKKHQHSSSVSTLNKLALLEAQMKEEVVFWTFYCNVLNKLKNDDLLLDKIKYWERLYPSTHTYIILGDVLQRKGMLEKAESIYWKAHSMAPAHQKPRYKLAKLYYRQNRFLDAKNLIKEVLTEKVKIYAFETYQMHRELREILDNIPQVE